MSGVQTRKVGRADDGLRLDRWFKTHFPALRHGALEKLLRTGQIRVNGGRAKANVRLSAGDDVRVPPLPDDAAPPRPRTAKAPDPEKIRADLEFIRSFTLYEDDAILVLNKPYGIAVQGGVGAARNIDAMLAGYLNKDGERPRLVHRLDRDTGGILILAKTRKAAASLSDALKRQSVQKTYWALTAGSPSPREGTINLAIGRTRERVGDDMHERMGADGHGAPAADAKKAITDYMTIDRSGPVAFLALKPVTGRTHQLRVHCAALETPIVGDFKYGGAAARIDGVPEKLHLFCRTMSFRHPATGAAMTLTAPLVGHMKETWSFFGFSEPAAIDWPDLRPRKR